MNDANEGRDDSDAMNAAPPALPVQRGRATTRPVNPSRVRATRVGVFADPLYGVVPVAQWAEDVLATAPFQRLAGVSLSNAPGDLLFERPFPSRLEHSLGVYHLARLARPRDRAVQAAALAHDLGHGPFSHMIEPLMRERLGVNHEQRSTSLLESALASLKGAAARRLAWLDPAEVAALMLGQTADGRGRLLNGQLDYDNIDNIARFLTAGDLGELSYDPIALARALRLATPVASMPSSLLLTAVNAMDGNGAAVGEDGSAATLTDDAPEPPPVMLLASAEDDALGWRDDRATVYRFLHEQHLNLALHDMLRKAVDMATGLGLLPDSFFDLTDHQALRFLEGHTSIEIARLIARVRSGSLYQCVWEGDATAQPVHKADEASAADPIALALGGWRWRLAYEAQLAAEAALTPDEVIITLATSAAGRALPPLATTGQLRDLRDNTILRHLPKPPPPRRTLHLFAAPDVGRDYVRRLRHAAERRLGALGIRASAEAK
ncbi:MAG TPA: HD domain-containing protein [Ktedonobacterales bacterium]|nr:HD domain-containing protein [Ktedonobacterales bacterium]